MRNTKPTIYKYHEAWAVKNGYRTVEPEGLHSSNTQAFGQQASNKLDRSSGLGYHRITEDSKKRAPKRSLTGPLSPSPARLSAMTQFEKSGRSCESSSGHKGPGLQEQSTSEQRLKHRGPTSTVNGQASKALLQQTSKHGPWNKFQAPMTKVLD